MSWSGATARRSRSFTAPSCRGRCWRPPETAWSASAPRREKSAPTALSGWPRENGSRRRSSSAPTGSTRRPEPRCSATVHRAQAGLSPTAPLSTIGAASLRPASTGVAGRSSAWRPLSRRRVYWYAAHRAEHAGDAGEDRLAGLLARHGSWAEPIPSLLAATRPQTLLRHELFDRRPIDAWGRDAVTLLGDAGHPMLPFLGQGACCALEDAVALGAALRDTEDPRTALRAYERDRAPRARRLVDGSRAAARVALASSPLLTRIRDAAMALVPAGVRLRQLDRVIGR